MERAVSAICSGRVVNTSNLCRLPDLGAWQGRRGGNTPGPHPSRESPRDRALLGTLTGLLYMETARPQLDHVGLTVSPSPPDETSPRSGEHRSTAIGPGDRAGPRCVRGWRCRRGRLLHAIATKQTTYWSCFTGCLSVWEADILGFRALRERDLLIAILSCRTPIG